MGLNTPLALALAALALPILLLYMLRLRRRPMPVSSLLLWQRVLEDQQANAPWQRLRRNLLLLLQLLLLLLLVLALARPFRTVDAQVSGNVVLLVDASASMQATDVAPSRFAAARNEARRVVRTLAPGSTVNLIRVAAEPQPLLIAQTGTDDTLLESTIAAMQADDAPADWETALTLAAAGAAGQVDSSIVIISDGAIDPAQAAAWPNLPGTVRWLNIGQGQNNQAIVALSTRESRAGPELFVQIANYAAETAGALLEIRLNGQLYDARNLTLPPFPEGVQSLTLTDLPVDTTLIEARLQVNDDLALDNQAAIRRQTSGGRVLLVSNQGNLFLERALALIPGLEVQRATPSALPETLDFELVVYDRTVPDSLPNTNLLFIAPPESTALFTLGGVFTDTRQSSLNPDHPVMQYLELEALQVAEARAIELPGWGQPLINSRGGPLLLVGEEQERRIGLLTFDLLRSDLPLQIEFPILISNLSTWLLAQPPLFREDDQAADLVPPLLNPAESDIRPGQTQLERTAENGPAAEDGIQGQQEFWWLLAAMAAVVLVWEWFLFWRGEV